MDLQIIVADSESTTQFQLGQTCTNVELTWSLFDQPGKLVFSNIDDDRYAPFFEGSNVVVAENGKKIFDGYVFKRKRTQEKITEVTAYDRIRYLQNKDVKVFENHSVSQIFSTICAEQQLPHVITNGSDYKTAPVLHDNKSYYDMIKRALDETFVATNAYLIVRDNGGQLELIDISNPSMITNIVLGDKSLVTGYEFESSIDSDTYNYIKVVQEDKKASKRDLYITLDSANIQKWGRLQYFEKADEELNEAQLKARADQLLQLFNRKTKTLKVNALGNSAVREGSGIGLAIKSLESEEVPYMHYAFTTKATHTYSNGLHDMSLEVEVV